MHAHVTGKHQPAALVTGSDLQIDDGGTQDMTGRYERHGPNVIETMRVIELDRLDLIENLECLGFGVKRGDPASVFAPLLKPLDLPSGVLFLNPSAVRE